MNHLQLQQAALPDLSESQISRLPKDQLAHFSNAVQQLHDWTLQMRGRINRGMETRYADQIRQAATLGQEEAARFRIDDGDLQIDVSQPKEIVWDQKHLSEIAERNRLSKRLLHRRKRKHVIPWRRGRQQWR